MKTFFKVCSRILAVCMAVVGVVQLLVLLDILREERELAAEPGHQEEQ